MTFVYFPQIIKNLRHDIEMTQNEVANRLGISRGMLSNYELGTREPDINMLIKIAEFYQVSVDYLVGNSDVRMIPSTIEENASLINQMFSLSEASKKDLCKYIELLKLRDQHTNQNIK